MCVCVFVCVSVCVFPFIYDLLVYVIIFVDPVTILSWGSWKWSCNETCCQYDHGKVVQDLYIYFSLSSVDLVIIKLCQDN